MIRNFIAWVDYHLYSKRAIKDEIIEHNNKKNISIEEAIKLYDELITK